MLREFSRRSYSVLWVFLILYANSYSLCLIYKGLEGEREIFNADSDRCRFGFESMSANCRWNFCSKSPFVGKRSR